ncbi:MAG TPA: bacteriohemerythrin [Candidatus Binataceae bacterium]|nr:bacteriohemerythrin [Candidatus Binataceae bacterium]
MQYANWTDRLSVGNATIDHQHKELISYLNQLHDAMLHGKEGSMIADLLGRLHDHTKDHFDREELLWASRKYAALEQHKHEHREFLVKILDLNLQLHSGKPINCLEVLVMLRDWFVHHIAHSDVVAAQATRSTAANRLPWTWF